MSLQKGEILKKLLREWPQGTAATSQWLVDFGVSRQLQNKYIKSQWLEKINHGAYKKFGDNVEWKGGLFALQTQAKTPIHAGALTSLELQGAAHYLRFKSKVFLFTPPRTKTPSWFLKHDWMNEVEIISTAFLPQYLGIIEHQENGFSIKISSRERAILECLYLAPKSFDLVECYHLLENLTTLRPNLLQEMLENCSSIRVKRSFLYMAEHLNYQWFDFLDTKKIELGSGMLSLAKGGVYDPKFKLMIPRELKEK